MFGWINKKEFKALEKEMFFWKNMCWCKDDTIKGLRMVNNNLKQQLEDLEKERLEEHNG